ncbi:hypothetical protein JYB64_20635 [Algoriphagus aestuarii]|nr:hypothetical protein [Algoriphagus aestuarii]
MAKIKMGKFRRTIDVARCKETGEIFRASERFIETKEAFLYRRLYHEKSISFECIECGQDLSISGSKNDKIHFKHFPDHDPCFLVQNKFNPEVQKLYERALVAKESERHKEIKQKIGDRLAFVEGVEADSISVDDKFIIKGRDRRKPDVYCRYKGKELVFEIQLSELSLGYILSRHNFYKDHGIYLIWILDTYDIRDQGTKEKDLKYLSNHQNFFKLDESVTDFKLICDYKFPFLTKDNTLLTPWRKKSIRLDQLSFDVQAMQTYFFDFAENLEKIKGQQIIKKEAIRVEEEKKLQVQIENAAHSKAQEIIGEIKRLKMGNAHDYSSVSKKVENLESFEVATLNNSLGLNNPDRYRTNALLKWIDEAKDSEPYFLSFILGCREIELDINAVDRSNRTVFIKVIEDLRKYKNMILRLLFRRGYHMNEKDRNVLQATSLQEICLADQVAYDLCNRLDNRDLVDNVFYNQRLLLIFESINQRKIIGFNYGEDKWVSFANNAIEYYQNHWCKIELALKRAELWEMVIESDKKKTFSKKLEKWNSISPAQDNQTNELLFDLFPYLIFQ